MIRPALAALTLAAATPALAQGPAPSPHLSRGFMACYARAGDNTVQRDVCAEREVGAHDDRLNKAYQQVMRQLSHDPAAKAACARRSAAGFATATTLARSTTRPLTRAAW